MASIGKWTGIGRDKLWTQIGTYISSELMLTDVNLYIFRAASRLGISPPACLYDACNQTGVLMSQLDVNAASCIATELIGRPYFAASIESYEVTGQPKCNAPASLS